MNLNAPKKGTWFVAIALAVIALVLKFVVGAEPAFWVACASTVLLICATYFANL